MAGHRPIVFREEHHTISARKDGRLRLAALSDTHGRPHPATYERVAAEAPDAVLHAGDVGDLAILDRLAAIAPVIAVRGNTDDRASGLPDAVVLTIVGAHGARLVAYLTHVAVRGARLLGEARQRADAADATLVVCGHSHVPLIVRDAGVAVFNPGSCGPRRYDLPFVFGVLDLGPDAVTLRHVDCETGERWTP